MCQCRVNVRHWHVSNTRHRLILNEKTCSIDVTHTIQHLYTNLPLTHSKQVIHVF